jgi:ABC-type multidrug transport system ATPase subunit
VQALKDFSFELMKGEILGIIGPNGAGKSTLFKLLSMMTQRNQGSIFILDKHIHYLQMTNDPRKIGIVAQDNIFWEDLTLHQNITIVGLLCGL